ncbi:DUF6065 family protein [uncultured Sphingomonas sp.]|uniref:DUF6065 family protein n=1 Tax=uncultured Sphingomonas sp. TaxID=158754 RepID=UPI0015759202
MTEDELHPLSIEFFKLHAAATVISPGNTKRQWMDETDLRFAYRCTPIIIANASGWEFACPFGFTVEWNGGAGRDAIQIRTSAKPGEIETFMGSHFGHGIVTFHTGWLIRTAKGWATWARGVPNGVKDGIIALEGVVETDWLPFPFTMNWKFTRPGAVQFEAGEAFCFVTPMLHTVLDDAVPLLRDLDDDAALAKAYHAWNSSRTAFNEGLANADPEALSAGWQKDYVRATHPRSSSHAHISKRALHAPRRVACDDDSSAS